jgi:hypothetical protein
MISVNQELDQIENLFLQVMRAWEEASRLHRAVIEDPSIRSGAISDACSRLGEVTVILQGIRPDLNDVESRKVRDRERLDRFLDGAPTDAQAAVNAIGLVMQPHGLRICARCAARISAAGFADEFRNCKNVFRCNERTHGWDGCELRNHREGL